MIGYRSLSSCWFRKKVRLLSSRLCADSGGLQQKGGFRDAGEHIESIKAALLAKEDPEIMEKILLLNLQMSSNDSAMTIILKRINDCISIMDRLDSLNGSTHPAF
ncbi:hypothetical protein NE237_029513 [Protea cynaroides]|uniref:Uncharacterized protein n=1 Tax=Protea cynaroides TaxID=273540 RepID=A0A9Q0JUW2_9MAGN|nr:hypothetical protein NE237_029513 [Protea cynaroides]